MKSKILLAMFLLDAAGMASIAHAESKNLSATYDICMDKSGGVTVEMNDCTSAELERQDKRLNAAYKAAMKALDAEQGKALKEIQRAWLKYRDLNCRFAGGAGGTSASVIGSSCFLTMTADRADELQSIAESQ